MAKVLFVSNDPSLFVQDSAARQRMYVYAAEIGDLHILSPAARGAAETHEGALHLYPVRVPRILRFFALRARARHLIRSEGIEVVSAQDPFELGLAALSARRGTAAVLHVQVHTDFLSPWFIRSGSVRMNLLNRVRVRTAGYVLRRARGVRVVSQRIKEAMAKRYELEVREPAVIPVVVEAKPPDPVPLPAHAFKFGLACVGRLEPEKRIGDLFAALALLKPEYRRAVGVFIIGTGRQRRSLEQRAGALGLSGSVVFLGHRPDAWALMRSAQAFIQTSAYEGYGRTLVEAALAGVPIITTDVGIVGDVLRPGKEALVAPVARPAAIAQHIETLVEENHTRMALTAAAKAAVDVHLHAAGDIPQRIAADISACLGV